MRFRYRLLVTLMPLGAAAMLGPAPGRANEPAETPAAAFAPLPTEALHNAYRVTDKVLSGAAPEDEASFAALRDLGVKTIISVDGARPDVATAHKFGLRYVHLPIGYDDVAPEEGKAIARAIDEVEGPIYVHCHHGKHRSAAAVATACVINGRLKPAQAESVLKTFGTGENYKGLWASALNARPIDKHELAAVKVVYREQAEVPPLADAMVAIDKTFDNLKSAERAGWRAPVDHPDIDPPHEALQLTEKLRELARTEDVRGRPEAFRHLLAENELAAQRLHEWLTRWKPAAAANVAAAAPAEADALFKTAASSCTACHKSFRDESAVTR